MVACEQMTRSSSLGMSHEGGGGAVGMRPMITVCSKCEANQLRGPRLRHDLDGWRGGGCRTGLVFRLWLGYSHIVGGQSNKSGGARHIWLATFCNVTQCSSTAQQANRTILRGATIRWVTGFSDKKGPDATIAKVSQSYVGGM